MTTAEFVQSVWAWVAADPSHIVVAASAIAALTPTPAPNTPWGRAYKVMELLALNFLHAKETGVNTASVAQEVIAILSKMKPPAPAAAPVVTPPAAPAPAVSQPTA